MRSFAAVSLNESTFLIFCIVSRFVLQCDQLFHDGLKFFFRCLLLLEQTFRWALFMLVSVNSPFGMVPYTSVDKNQMQFAYLRTFVPI